MLGPLLFDNFPKVPFFFVREEADAVVVLAKVRHRPGRVGRNLAIENSQPVAERDERSIAVEGRGCPLFVFSGFSEATFNVFRGELFSWAVPK